MSDAERKEGSRVRGSAAQAQATSVDSRGILSEEATRVTGRRVLAHLVDGLVFSLAAAVIVVPVALTGSNLALGITFLVVAFLGPIPYYVLSQRRTGQSPGKRLMGIKVVGADGATPSSGALLRRTVPLLFEYLYLISLVAILASPYRQRLGDRWGGTYVIEA